MSNQADKQLLSGFTLCEERDAWHAHKKMKASGGYFEGVWQRGNG